MDELREIVARALDKADTRYYECIGRKDPDGSQKREITIDEILSALRAERALVGSKLAAEIGNAFTGFPKCHMFVCYKSDGMGEPHDEGSYYAIKIQDKGSSINFGMTELALELFANEALSRIEADRATNTQEGE